MKLADALVEMLRDWDVQYVFGVSGANIEHLHDAIHRHGQGKLVSVLARTEMGAAFMADCRARVHRRLSVCCATSGGGMLNLAVGIAESYAEAVPVLAIVGQPPTSLEGRGAFQDSSGIGNCVDAVLLWRSISKYVGKIRSPHDFWPMLREAVVAATSGRQGPAVLLVPRDLFDQEVSPPPVDWPSDLQSFCRSRPVGIGEVMPLLEAIRSARRPLLLVGQGVRRSDDAGAVEAFARAVGLPVVTTMSARADFPNDDPLYLGTVGAAGHPSAHAYLRDEADLVIAAGATLDVMTRAAVEKSFKDKRFVVIDVDPEAIHRVLQPEITLYADVGRAFRALLDLLERRPMSPLPPIEGYTRRCYEPRLAPAIPGDDPGAAGPDTLLQSEALAILAEFLPAKGHVVLDAGNCAAAAMHYLPVPEGSTSTIALGMGGMGYSIPGAIGAQLGSEPGTRTTVICGDGSFLMLGLEVHTAVDLGLPILFVVFNNAMHGMCVTRQQLLFESRIEAVRYPEVDFAALAGGLAPGDRLWVGSASTPQELRERLSDYRDNHRDVPGVLDLRLLREEIPPFAPFLGADAPTIPTSAFAA
ncbi:thiamine pyrophosphate-binding protein [Sorangium atrum]|uniref:Thiamine pyrophosphate-binding protein n=1 Tax=Sorangium atrum TaxID=2995308 RepID=A0ABT5C8G6_9BACT|nr:thiamine pyrophosphate-binding protein [Sorangium aterium]MDC0682725.1 thiamine pyrophosphate-binding protein [Sorangium aterium]